MKKREFSYDNLKFIMIFLVIFGHFLQLLMEKNSISETLYIFIYAFHMPIFVYITGHFAKKTDLSKLVKAILLPYIIFNIIWSLASSIYLKELNLSFIHPGWTLWFLLSLFFWRLLVNKFTITKHFIIPSYILALAIGFFPNGSFLSISRTFAFFPFFVLGNLKSLEYKNKILPKIAAIIIIISTFTLALNLTNAITPESLFLRNSYMCKSEFIDSQINQRHDINPNICNSFKFTEIATHKDDLLPALFFRLGFLLTATTLIWAFIQLAPQKEYFFTKYGQRSIVTYLLHIYPLMLITFLLNLTKYKNNLAVIFILSGLLTIGLSQKPVFNIYDTIMTKLGHIVPSKKQKFK